MLNKLMQYNRERFGHKKILMMMSYFLSLQNNLETTNILPNLAKNHSESAADRACRKCELDFVLIVDHNTSAQPKLKLLFVFHAFQAIE